MRNYLRIFFYFLGLFFLTIGIAISIKANMGISPVSSVPYTFTVVWGIELGIATIIFHSILVLIQFCLLKKDFSIKNLLQVPVGIVFGFFTSFSVYLISFISNPTDFYTSIIYLIISIVVIAIGEITYLPSDFVCLASSGVIQVVANVLDKPFSHIKLVFDIVMVFGSGIICLLTIGSLGSVGLGTIISAILIGPTIKLIVKLFYMITGIRINLRNN